MAEVDAEEARRSSSSIRFLRFLPATVSEIELSQRHQRDIR